MFESLKARMAAFVLAVIAVISILFCGVAYWKMKEAMNDANFKKALETYDLP